MTTRPVLCSLLIGLAVLWAPVGYAECECPTDSVVQAVLNADRIFGGEVVSAAVSENDTKTIEFVVEVERAIRGSLDSEYRLNTQVPGGCGVSVRLGFHDMYILGPGDSTVSSCTGSGRAVSMRYGLLSAAITLVDLPESDASGAQQLLSKQFYSSYRRDTVDEFFDLVDKIDPSGNTSTRLADRIEYRGVVVHFADGKFSRVEEVR